MKSFTFETTVITLTKNGIVLMAPNIVRCMSYNQLLITRHSDYIVISHSNMLQSPVKIRPVDSGVLDGFFHEIGFSMRDYMSSEEINQKQ